jgi:hypothetical protein
LMIFSGCFLGHIFDVHAAGFGGHDDHLGRGAIRQNAEVELLGDVEPLLDQQFLDLFASGAGLFGDQVHPQNAVGVFIEFFRRPGNLDAAAQTASAGVDLCFHHHRVCAQFSGSRLGLFDGKGDGTVGNGNAVLAEKFFGLVFMNFHGWASFFFYLQG